MSRSLLAALAVAGVAAVAQPLARQTDALAASASGIVRVAPPTGQQEADRASTLAALEQAQPGDTIQFARGMYLVGRLIPVSTPRLTLLGHPEGTTLRGCDPAQLDVQQREIVQAMQSRDTARAAAVVSSCGMFQISGGHTTVRNLVFEYTGLGLILGCCHLERVLRPDDGAYRIEGNTFRNSSNGIRPDLASAEPTVIRGNRFVNVFHAVSAAASHLHVLDNDISAPEPGRVPALGYPSFAIALGGSRDPRSSPTVRLCESNIIEGNRIEGHPDGILMIGTSCRNNVIRDNTIVVRRVRLPDVRPVPNVVEVTDETDSTIVGVPLALESPPRPPGQPGDSTAEGMFEDNLIEGNHVIGADGLGMIINRASRNRIVNNSITGISRRNPFPGNTLAFPPARWREANGSGIWVSQGSNENEIVGNTFTDIASYAVVLEGDRNVVETRSAADSVRDVGTGNRVSVVRRSTQADTLQYVVVNHGRQAGEMRVVRRGDSVIVRYHDRDRIYRSRRRHVLYVARTNGTHRVVEVRGLSPGMEATEVDERFELMGRTASWRSPIDSGSASVDGPRYYQPREDNPYGVSRLARYLLDQPGHTADLLPFGSACAIVAADTMLNVGGVQRRLRFVQIEGAHEPDGPVGVWLDDDGALVATAAEWLITVRRGAESILPMLRTIELAWFAEAAEEAARRLAPPSSRAIAIRNGNVFDSERGEVLERTTVLIEGDRIVAVGPAASVAIPAGARVIDATGKTVLPGLWDMHTHSFAVPQRSALHLAAGVTTIRDLGSDIDVALLLRERADAGTILSPRVILAGFIDGPGERAGPTDGIVSTENEARRRVARYDSLGYRQIKLYDLVHPILIPTIVSEAKRRRMRVSGHVPLGISAQTAIRMGFDEIQHAPALISTFFPESTFLPLPRPTGVIVESVAQAFDLDAPEVTQFLELMRERGTVIDGTFNLFQHIPFRTEPLPDGTDAVFGPTLEWLPPLVRRAMMLENPPNAQQATRTEAARALYLRLLRRLSRLA